MKLEQSTSPTEVLRWLQTTKYTGNKIKVKTESKEIYQQLLDFIYIETIKVEIKTLQKITPLLCPWIQSSISHSTRIPSHGKKSIPTYFIHIKVLCKKCSAIRLLM